MGKMNDGGWVVSKDPLQRDACESCPFSDGNNTWCGAADTFIVYQLNDDGFPLECPLLSGPVIVAAQAYKGEDHD